jgi:transposase
MAGMGEEGEFKRYEQHQGALLPVYIGDALDPSDVTFFIDDAVEGVDLRAFERRYSTMGEHAYPPRMLLKLWLLGAIEGVYSGRAIARRVYFDLRFQYLAGALRPDFRTINRFRVRHRAEFAEVFLQTVQIARASGLAKLGRVAIDGSKLRANTSRHKAMSHGRMVEAEAHLEDEIGQILAQMDELNEGEDREHGDDEGGGGLPQELHAREQRREKIRAARERLEAEKGEKLESRHQKSFADPEANMMKTGDGALGYCYNAQAATSEDGIVVATGLSATVRDVSALIPMIEAVEANTGECPGVALADQGYLSEATLAELSRRGQRCLVAVGRERRKAPNWPRGEFTQRMHRVLRLPWAQALYAHRKTQAERPFAEIKQRLRFQRFMLRGQEKVRGEWDLVCAALNLQTLWRRTAA